MTAIKEEISYTYHYRGMPLAKFTRTKDHKLDGKLIPPFDLLIIGLPNEHPLEVDPNSTEPEIFGMETISDIKKFLFNEDTFTVRTSE